MARRIIRFPLKMKNGFAARTLEELRANADLESIMSYYFNGTLSRWCRTLNLEDISANFVDINGELVRKIYDRLGIPVSDEEIKAYVSDTNVFNPLRMNTSGNQVIAGEDEEELTDNEKVKEKLKEYVDGSISLDAYKIDVMPIENDEGKVTKYRIIVECEKTEQYTRFTMPYELNASYTKERFEKDLYRKILNCFRRLQEETKYNSSQFTTMNVGETFCMGRYEGKAIEWIVLKKESDSLYVISKDIICQRQFHTNSNSGSNNWTNCDLRRWLNNDFYNNTFSAGEKEFIMEKDSDKITLLSEEEAESLMSESERAVGSWWWLRSPGPDDSNLAWNVYSDGSFYGCSVGYTGCVRPAFNLKF